MSGSSDVSPRHDGDLFYLTDTAYFALFDHEASEERLPSKKNRPDGLFLERLESFIEGQQKDMEAFANREQRPLDEIRKLVAIPHARYIFSPDISLPQTDDSPQVSNATHIPSIRSTLGRLSNTLQMLHSASGIDSLLLVVSPHPTPTLYTASATSNADFETHQNATVSSEYEASWIGGTDLGKEFWMGLKGGGVNGARAFRIKCQMRREAELLSPDLDVPTPIASPNTLRHNPPQMSDGLPTTQMRSGDVKTELNAAVRHALRSVSGNPSAEMRWTKPASLEELYNVRLVGWPPGVHMRNPSNNILKDNRLLLDLIRSGNMKFIQRGSPEWGAPATVPQVKQTFADKTTLQNINSVSPASENTPIVPSHSPAVDSVQFPSLPVDPLRTFEGSSQSPSHVSDGLCHPSSFPLPGSAEAVNDVSTSIPIIPRSSWDTFAAVAGSMAPKRPVEDNSSERETQEAREAKRTKLDSAPASG